MGFSNDLTSEVTNIFRSQWSERDGQQVPTPTDIRLANDAVKLNGTVLYADIDGSTGMVDTLKAAVAAEIYKTFLLCSARIIRSEGGEITAYDGDRVMAVFIGDSKNTRAVRCALKINHAVTKIINPAFKKQYADTTFALRHAVGIDTSNMYVARTGIRGDNDLVWVGRAANYAAKLSGLSDGPFSTFITEEVFASMNTSVKQHSGQSMWEQRLWKGMSVYRSSWMWVIEE